MDDNKEWVEVEVAPSAETPKADETPVAVPEESKETKEPDEQYGHRARKRIQQLVGSVKDRDAELQQLREELRQEREKSKGAESSAYAVYRKAQEERMKAAEAKHDAAYESADGAGLKSAVLEMIAASVELRALDAWERNEKERAAAPAPAPAQPAPNNAAAEWMARNQWFGQGENKDRVATMAAAAISEELVKEGFDAASPEFYEEMESRLVKELPRLATKVGGSREQETRKPVVAGQSRTPSRRIRLDEGTVRASNRLGASLEDTARYMEKIQDAGDGYVNIDIKRGRK